MDGVTCGFALRNLVDLEQCFAEMARVLEPGGSLAMLEVSAPTNPVLAFGHRFYFGRVVPLIGGLDLRWRLRISTCPRSVAYLPPTPELLAMIERGGFRQRRNGEQLDRRHLPTDHRTPSSCDPSTKCSAALRDDDIVMLGGRDGGFVGRGERARIDLPGWTRRRRPRRASRQRTGRARRRRDRRRRAAVQLVRRRFAHRARARSGSRPTASARRRPTMSRRLAPTRSR